MCLGNKYYVRLLKQYTRTVCAENNSNNNVSLSNDTSTKGCDIYFALVRRANINKSRTIKSGGMPAFLATFAWNPKNVNTERRMPAASRVLCVIIPKLSADNNLLAERREQRAHASPAARSPPSHNLYFYDSQLW